MPKAGTMRQRIFTLNKLAPLANGLVFAGLGCAPGTYLYKDSSKESKGNDGTLTNMDPATDWVWADELGRRAIEYDADDDYIPTPVTWKNTSPGFTVAWWLNTTSIANYTNRIGTGTAWAGFGFHCAAGDKVYCGLTAQPADRFEGVVLSGFAVNVWTHIAFTVETASKQMYLYGNGIQQFGKVANAAPATWTEPLYVGVVTNGQEINGRVADACIWNRALSPSEIAALADPSNVNLSYGGVPLIAPFPRRLWSIPAASGGHPAFARFANVPFCYGYRGGRVG